MEPMGRLAIDRELLEEQTLWVHTLARSLVRDADGAHDIAQETLLAALSAPPSDAPDVRRLRAWLGKVAYNLAHLSLRRSSRRRAREECVARCEELGSTADSVIRAALLDHVEAAVNSLEEPYRTTVHLRYFEGLSTLEIATRTCTSETSVRKRLWRAREKLRKRLDGSKRPDDSGREYWLSGLGWLSRSKPGSAKLLSASPFAKLVLAGLLLGTGLSLSWSALERSWSAAPRVAREPSRTAAADDVQDAPGGALNRASSRRALVRGPGRDSQERTPPRIRELLVRTPEVQEYSVVRGSVIDLSGWPVQGAEILDEHANVLGTSDALGFFALRVAELPLELRPRREDLAVVKPAALREGQESWKTWLVTAKAVDVSGSVVDPLGRPVSDAVVELEYEEQAFLDLPELIDMSSAERPLRVTAPDGGFDLLRIPTGRGIRLVARHARLGVGRCAVPADSASGLCLVLGEPDGVTLAGIVADLEGSPVPGARVSIGSRGTWSDGRGGFRIDLERALPGAELVATKRDFLPAAFDVSNLRDGQQGHIRMILGGLARSITGRVLGEEGEPLEDWLVFACLTAEDALAVNPGEITDPTAAASTSGPGGSFEIGGLSDRRYEIVAFDPRTLVSGRSAGIRSGARDIEIRIEQIPVVRRGGTIVDARGIPCSGAFVEAALALTTEAGVWRMPLGATDSDELGRFAFAALPRQGLSIRVQHPDIVPQGFVEAPSDGGDLGVQVEPLAELSVSCSSAETVSLLDAQGNPLPIVTQARFRTAALTAARMHDGRSGWMGVSEGARTLVRLRKGQEIGRHPVDLRAGLPLQVDLR